MERREHFGRIKGTIAHLLGLSVLLLTAFIIEPNAGAWFANKAPLEVAGGLGAIYVAIWTVWLLNKRTTNSEQTLAHTRLSEQAGRFHRGADMLASESIASRVAGVVLLRDIAEMNPAQYYNAILNLLIVFAEEQTAGTWEAYERLVMKPGWAVPAHSDWPVALAPTPEDVVAAVTAIGRIRKIDRRRRHEPLWVGGDKLRLRRVILAHCTIRGGRYDDMEMDRVCFFNVKLIDCSLRNTDVRELDVIDAWFRRCDLRGADINSKMAIDDQKPPRRLAFQFCDLRGANIAAGTERVVLDDCRDERSTIKSSNKLPAPLHGFDAVKSWIRYGARHRN